MNPLQTEYLALRGKREVLARAITAAEGELETDRAAVAAAVAEGGKAPDGWAGKASRAGHDAEALALGLAALDEEIRRFLCASQLAVARIVTKRQEPAQHQLAESKTRRVALLTAAARAVTPGIVAAGEPPATFLKEFVALEAELALIRAELAEIAAEIAAVTVAP